MSARELHAVCQFQYESFGGWHKTFDDMYGALGRAHVYLAVTGQAQRYGSSGYVFNVKKYGIYIRDIYEFNDSQPLVTQPLGLWTHEKTLGKAQIVSYFIASPEVMREQALETVHVSNKDFRKYRDAKKMGGDFYIFSDVEWRAPAPDEAQIDLTHEYVHWKNPTQSPEGHSPDSEEGFE